MHRFVSFISTILLLACTTSVLAQPLTPERERALKAQDSFKECDICPEMMVVPAGSFTMGSPKSEKGRDMRSDEDPRHRVTIAKAFAVGKFEVTVDQFAAFVAETGYDAGTKCYVFDWRTKNAVEQSGFSWRNPIFSQGGTHPVACINWNDAKAYVAALSRKTGKAYRLLTEAEWEYAARAGTTTRYNFGDHENALCRHGNGLDESAKRSIPGVSSFVTVPCNDRHVYTAPVGSFSANKFGLYDMHGNVWEWTEDCYNTSYRGAPANGSAWTTGDCSRRILRGGSWSNAPWWLRVADRDWDVPADRNTNNGIRVARTLVTAITP